MNPKVTVIQPVTEENSNKIRVAAYCRVSSDSADQLNSFMVQMRYYENLFADSETEILAGIYADEGVTGTRMDKREEFQRMIKDCRKGKIDRIITKSISRFSRNTKDCLSTLRELSMLGITVTFEKENIDTANISDEMMITIMGGLAQEESISISQNMRWSIERRMRNGTYIVSNLPYGYKKINGKFAIDEKESKIVQRIFSEYLQGMGVSSICSHLNEDGIFKNGFNDIWQKNDIRYILSNEKYIGDCLWRKKYTENVFPFKKSCNRGDVSQYYVHNDHEAIISREIFETVQKLLKERGLRFGNKEFQVYPLSKKVVCGKCGSTFVRKKISEKVFWICSQHNLRAENCSIKAIPEEKIYTSFIRMFNKLKLNFKTILLPLQKQIQELKAKYLGVSSHITEIQKEIANLREQTHVLARLKTKGFLDDSKYHEQITVLNSKISHNQKEIKKIITSADDDESEEELDVLIDLLSKNNDILCEFDENIFDVIVEKIVVKSQNELEFHLIGGLKFR